MELFGYPGPKFVHIRPSDGSKDLFQDPSSAQNAQNPPFSGPLGLPLRFKSNMVGEFCLV